MTPPQAIQRSRQEKYLARGRAGAHDSAIPASPQTRAALLARDSDLRDLGFQCNVEELVLK